jgi:2-polyprenyl-6-hydroxyphenyl methylase/3-demethylubiquinone-9 3-methyltransferase
MGKQVTGKDKVNGSTSTWDHTTHPDFYAYYENESQSEATLQRFRGVQATVLRVAVQLGMPSQLDVADVGCGAGTQCRLWAEQGHRVNGVDINEPLIRLGRERAHAAGLDIRFEVGSATALPWADASIDVCLLPELLEHVADWQSCVYEAARILRPGGLLYVSTTNVLCPKQQEFTLPLYSWYPARLKRYFERIAVTTRPAIANFAKYPAVNWFSFYGLRDFLGPLGFRCMDRFDLTDLNGKSRAASTVVRLARSLPVLRFLGHVATSSIYFVAIKSARA